MAPKATAVFPDNVGGGAICIKVGRKRATAAQTADEPSRGAEPGPSGTGQAGCVLALSV